MTSLDRSLWPYNKQHNHNYDITRQVTVILQEITQRNSDIILHYYITY